MVFSVFVFLYECSFSDEFFIARMIFFPVIYISNGCMSIFVYFMHFISEQAI